MEQQPPKLVYDTNTYLTISLPSGSSSLPFPPSASSISAQSNSSSEPSPVSAQCSSSDLRSSLTYVGPVGRLPDSHIYSLPVPTANPPQEEVKDVKEWLESQGVVDVEVMNPKLRSAKRKVF